MGELLLRRREDEERRLRLARGLVGAEKDNWEALALFADAATDRMAVPLGPLDETVPVPPRPAAYTAVASDGSEIDPDRHGAGGNFYVINIGTARIPYGQPGREAELRGTPTLGFEDHDLYLVDPTNPRRQVPVRERHLDARRTVQELKALADLAETEAAQHGDVPIVALVDGTLLFSVLEDRPRDFLREHFYTAFAEQLDRLRAADVALAAYASRTRGIDLVSLFRSRCGGDPTACTPCSASRPTGRVHLCAFAGMTDALLLSQLLSLWERTQLFRVRSNVHDPFYRDHRACFFLLQTEQEIARVEVPLWVAQDARKLGWVHAVLVDQVQKGLGYPAVLARADDRAVISTQDRTMLDALVRQEFIRRGVQALPSAKLGRKQVRTV